MEELSPAEKAALANAAKRKVVKHNPSIQKEEVSPEEYKRRLEESMKRDSYLIKQTKDERIAKAIKDWRSKVGARFGDATTDNPRIIDRLNRLERGDGHKTSMILSGNLGIGKTWASYAYINEAIKRGIVTPGQIIADSESAVISKIASAGFKRTEYLDELLSERYKIYFIDDVGQGYFSNEGARAAAWYELIDHVYSRDITLIITTNKTFQMVNGYPSHSPDLENWIGKAAYDRLRNIVGPDGVIVPGNVNKRPGVFENRENASR